MVRLSFTRDGKVYFGDTLAGRLEPLQSSMFRWGYFPETHAFRTPNALRRQFFAKTQRELKSSLRRKVRLICGKPEED